MNTSLFKASAFVVMGALFVTACMPSAPPKLLGQPINKPVTIMVRVPPAAGSDDDQGGTAAMVEAVEHELEARGVETRLSLRDDENPPPPRIELWVNAWSTWRPPVSGVFGTATVLNYIFPAGQYDVVCKIYREGDRNPALVRRFDGHVHDRSTDASVRIGTRIGEKVAFDALVERSKRPAASEY